MESANRVPFCLSGYYSFDIRWVVPVPGLTGLAITSRRSHNLLKLISPAELLKVSGAAAATARCFRLGFSKTTVPNEGWRSCLSERTWSGNSSSSSRSG